MKKNKTQILFIAITVIIALSMMAYAFGNRGLAAGGGISHDPNAELANLTVSQIEEITESVNQDIRDTVPVDSETYIEIQESNADSPKNAANGLSDSLSSFKENWSATALSQIQEESPIGSTYPLTYMSRDKKEMLVLYKDPDGTIVKKIATYKAPKDSRNIDLYEMYDISEERFAGEPLPEIMQKW